MNETLSEMIRVSWNYRYRQNTETVRKTVKPLCKRKGIENKRKLLPSFVRSFTVFGSHSSHWV